MLHQDIFDDDIISVSDGDKKPSASNAVEDKRKLIHYMASMENKATFDNELKMRHEELVAAINQQTKQLFALSECMNKSNELMDKSTKMAIHMDIVVDKLFKMVEQIFKVVADGDAVDTAGACSLTRKVEMLSHPDLIKLRDSLEALGLPDDQNLRKFHNAFVKEYNQLLLYYQKHNTSKISSTPEHKVLYEFVKNQKTNLRNYKQNNDGPFAKDPKYIKFLKYLGVTYP
jgi:urease gamma subunit